MTVLLVLATFLIFIVIDTILTRRKAGAPIAVKAEASAEAEPEQSYVEGFLVPRDLRYHPGHSWLLRERKNVMRVGVDEFAAALLGKIEKIELPKPGHWVRQGQNALGFTKGAEKAEMVSPIEGEVVEVNPEVVNNPALLRSDPYGKGWLMSVFVPDEESTTRNLLPRNLVQAWMRETVEKLYGMQPQMVGAVAADGGKAVEDLSLAFPKEPWSKLTGEFFLTR